MPERIRAEIERCDLEIAEMDQRPDRFTSPAWLVALGRNDWEHERRLIAEEAGA